MASALPHRSVAAFHKDLWALAWRHQGHALWAPMLLSLPANALWVALDHCSSWGAKAAVFALFALTWVAGGVGWAWVATRLTVLLHRAHGGGAAAELPTLNQQTNLHFSTAWLVGWAASLGTVLGALFCLVPGALIYMRTLYVVPLVVAENAGFTQAFTRSNQVYVGQAWRAQAVITLVWMVDLLPPMLFTQLGYDGGWAVVLSAPFDALRGLMVVTVMMLYAESSHEPEFAPQPARASGAVALGVTVAASLALSAGLGWITVTNLQHRVQAVIQQFMGGSSGGVLPFE